MTRCGSVGRGALRMRLATDYPLDLSENQALNDCWQIIVKPRFKRRPQHFTHQILEGPPEHSGAVK
jgi:hypothetical protein